MSDPTIAPAPAIQTLTGTSAHIALAATVQMYGAILADNERQMAMMQAMVQQLRAENASLKASLAAREKSAKHAPAVPGT